MRRTRAFGLTTFIFLLSIAALHYAWGSDVISAELEECDSAAPQQIVTLFDVQPANEAQFRMQQVRVAKTLRHLDAAAGGRNRSYALFAFHHQPTLLDHSANISEIVAEMSRLSPPSNSSASTFTPSSPAKALDAAAEYIIATSRFAASTTGKAKSRASGRYVILLVHDGRNTDLIAETLEAITKLARIGAEVFVISGDADAPNVSALLGYVARRKRIFVANDEITSFFDALDEHSNPCFEEESLGRRRAVAADPVQLNAQLSARPPNDAAEGYQLNCLSANKVDLLLMLDTSGSVFNTFERERQLAVDLVDALKNASGVFPPLRIGVLKFAADATVVLSLRDDASASSDEVARALWAIAFTGRNTRIADAVKVAAAELAKTQRDDVLQIVVLISDGHGQEYWHDAQTAAKELQRTGAHIFATSTSVDFNAAELALYAVGLGGDGSGSGADEHRRVFVGANHKRFVPSVSALINKCLADIREASDGGSVSFDAEQRQLEMAKMRLEGGSTDAATDPFQNSSAGGNAIGLKWDPAGNSVAESTASSALRHDEPQLTSEEEVERVSERLRNHQNLSRLPDDCLTDVLFLVDQSRTSSGGVEVADYAKQLDVVSGLVRKLDPVDVAAGRVRLAAISFGKSAFVEAEFGAMRNATAFIERLLSIRPQKTHSSFVRAIEKAVQLIEATRRANAKLIIVIAWSGLNGRDTDAELDAAARLLLLRTPNSEIYSVTLNRKGRVERLATVTGGDKWHVYVGARVPQFVEQAGDALIACRLAPSADQRKTNATSSPTSAALAMAEMMRELDAHVPMNSVEKVEHLQMFGRQLQRPLRCDQDPIDVLIIIDTTNAAEAEQRRAAQDAIKQAHADDYERRVCVAVLIVNGDKAAHTVISLRDTVTRDDALFAIDRLELLPGGDGVAEQLFTSSSKRQGTLNATLKEVEALRRHDARLAIVALTALSLEETLQQNALLTRLYDTLRVDSAAAQQRAEQSGVGASAAATGAPILLVLSTPTDVFGELSASGRLRMFKERRAGSGYHRFVSETRRKVFACRSGRNALSALTSAARFGESAELDFATSLDQLKSGLSAADSVQLDAPSVSAAMNSEDAGDTLFGGVEKALGRRRDDADGSAAESGRAESEAPAAAPFSEVVEASTARTLGVTFHPTVTFDLDADHPRVSLLNAECRVDLVLVIDTSQSVADEFHRQLQFAVDLVQRLPDEDFAQRVQVAAVVFHRTASLHFGLGALRDKSAVLNALLVIEHTGGSTSAVSGVELAAKEMAERRRINARQMFVLISDGNSQDPWERVVAAAQHLRALKADVYAVTVSHDYFFRELELYAGNKWFVYIDARIRQFLDEAEMSLVECRRPSVPSAVTSSSAPTAESVTSPVPPPDATEPQMSTAVASSSFSDPTVAATVAGSPADDKGRCDDDPVDVLFVLDTSTSVEQAFYAQKNFALDLIKVLPQRDFQRRVRVAFIKFNAVAERVFGFGGAAGGSTAGESRTRNDLLYEIERVEYVGGQTSLAAGVRAAVDELRSERRRADARLVTVIISDGNSQDEWTHVQEAAAALAAASGPNAATFAVTLSPAYHLAELREYVGGDETHVYAEAEKRMSFIQNVGRSIIDCASRKDASVPQTRVDITPTPSVEVDVTSVALDPLKSDDTPRFRLSQSPDTQFARDEQPINAVAADTSSSTTSLRKQTKKCTYSKMDLIIILDASTSRENVFEHQRELALSLVERLPISKDDTHVATGINSFSSVPTLRQTLGLGRDRNMVRKAIEDIKYHGGSTLTAHAVDLAVQDLERGRRPDALQVVVLMNDGMSQDPWQQVLESSARLAATGAERFGVALGSEVDLRELRHYIGDEARIYRDGSTERFLNDVVSLLNGGERDCQTPTDAASAPPERVEPSDISDAGFFDFQQDACAKPQLDIVVLFDNADNTPHQTDAKVNANRYLLLDLLGSLPLGDEQVRLGVLTFGAAPTLIHRFTDPQDRDSVFERIESIQPVRGHPSYAIAVAKGLDYASENRRPDARSLFLILGDGKSSGDGADELTRRADVSARVRKTEDIAVHAVDSGKEVNMAALTVFTGSAQRVYNYDRNSEFAKVLSGLVTAGHSDGECTAVHKDEKVPEVAESIDEVTTDEKTYSTPPPPPDYRNRTAVVAVRQRDLLASDKAFGIDDGAQKRVVVAALPKANANTESVDMRKVIDVGARRPSIGRVAENDISAVSVPLTSTTTTAATTQPTVVLSSPRPTVISSFQFQSTRSPLSSPSASFSGSRLSLLLERAQSNAVIAPSGRAINDFRQSSTGSSLPPSASGSPSRFLLLTGRRTTTVAPTPTPTRRPPLPSALPLLVDEHQTTEAELEAERLREASLPGCPLDLLILLDASGSVRATFEREKALAASLVRALRIGANHTRVALIKFAAADKVRVVHAFDAEQRSATVLRRLDTIGFSSGTTAIHSALLQAIAEYSPLRGARPGRAQPLAVVFTDGFAQQDVSAAAQLLRRVVPQLFAVAVDTDYPVWRHELERITGGETSRIFTESTFELLRNVIANRFARNC